MSDNLTELMAEVNSAFAEIEAIQSTAPDTWEVELEGGHVVQIHDDSVQISFVMSLGRATQRTRYKTIALLHQYRHLSQSTQGFHIATVGYGGDVCAMIELNWPDVSTYSLLGILATMLAVGEEWQTDSRSLHRHVNLEDTVCLTIR